MKKKARVIEIYTDGGCDIMGDKIGTWAYVVVENDKILHEAWKSDKNITNSIVELTAMKNAYLYALKHFPNDDVTIYCDSSYIVSGTQDWGDNWLKTNYKNGKIKYQHLWNEFLPFRKSNIKTKWIKGHNGHKWNTYVDKLTHNGRDKANYDSTPKYRKEAPSEIMDLLEKVLPHFSFDDFERFKKIARAEFNKRENNK